MAGLSVFYHKESSGEVLSKKALRSASELEILTPKKEAREETALRGPISSSRADRAFLESTSPEDSNCI